MSTVSEAGRLADNFFPWRTVQGRDRKYYGNIRQHGAPAGGVYSLSSKGTYKLICGEDAFRYSNRLTRTGAFSSALFGVGQDGSIYGSTHECGVFGCGLLFKIDRHGKYQPLHYFDTFSHGKGPVFARSNGDVLAGLNSDNPLISKLSKDGNVSLIEMAENISAITETANNEIIVGTSTYSNSGALWRLNANDEPELLVVLDEQPGKLVPLPEGDVLCLTGTRLLRISTAGVITPIHEFSVPFQGLMPTFVTIAKDGSYIGTTAQGGLENQGTVFQITPTTNSFALLDHLPGENKRGPGAGWMEKFFPLRVEAESGNRPPMAEDDYVAAESLELSSGGLRLITIPVTKNDFDSDGDVLTITSIGTPSHGTVEVDESTQTIRYTANSAQVENDSFTYTVVDGNSGNSTAHVFIRTNPAGRYVGGIGDINNPDTNAGELSLTVKSDGMATGKVQILQETYRFSGRFNEVNRLGVVLISNPRRGNNIGMEIWLRPDGSGWTAECTIQKNGLPFGGTCSRIP